MPCMGGILYAFAPGSLRDLRVTGWRVRRARHKSYCDCIFIHSSRVVPRAAARGMAMAAEIPALPLSTGESVTRVIRRWAAAVVTARSPKYSRRTRPGWGGLRMRFNESDLPRLSASRLPAQAAPWEQSEETSSVGLQLPFQPAS
jgi:hypothetical protein